jgi:hypothetical protein
MHHPVSAAILLVGTWCRVMIDQWQEPRADWLPLALAVFRFGMRDGPGSNALHKPYFLTAAEFALIASRARLITLLESKPLTKLTAEDIALIASRSRARLIKLLESTTLTDGEFRKIVATPPSRAELTSLLRERAGAREATIDAAQGNFSFDFYERGRGAQCIGGPPWAILAPPHSSIDHDPRRDAEALFNKNGFGVRSADEEEAARYAKQSHAVQEATGLVWRQYMLRAFDRAIAARRVLLFARIETAWAPFRQLPADLWPSLDVLDWQIGLAGDPGGGLYYAIHAASETPVEKAQVSDETETASQQLTNSSRRQSNQGALDAAIRKRLDEGEQPGLTVPWEQFCDAVLDDTNGWVDRKQRRAKRSYGDKTIKRIVKEQRRDKQDK